MPGFYATVARYYDAEHRDKTDDLELYSELAADTGGPIFEVACGTGRVMLHLAQDGYEVDGIDIEPAMLDRARRKANVLPDDVRSRLRFHQGDVLKFDTDRRYKLVILSYNALLHFHEQDDQLALLRRLHRWLADDGLLVIDQVNPGDSFGAQDTDALLLEKTFLDPDTGHLVMQSSVSSLDRTEQLLRVTWIYDEVGDDGTVKRTFAPVVYRYIFYYELRLLLLLAGFAVQAVYGSTELDPYEDGCDRMVVLARKGSAEG
ncbi:MAG: class I SAM-dependent methyltransferase [Chloroflexi bacterium]|nr:class I SAM-dependent methyltransferase [Chloroflexota bacterium]